METTKNILRSLVIFGFVQLLVMGVVASDPSPPMSPVKLIFIHHSTGQNWLADGNGGLGIALRNNNYFVSDTNYGWGPQNIGSYTDIGNWYDWFRGPKAATYLADMFNESGQHSSYSRLASNPGGPNRIVMFKSCFPNSALRGSLADPIPVISSNPLRSQSTGSGYHTVSNAKGIYIDLLEYFATKPDTLFIVITAPPLSDATYSSNARAFNQWLVNDWLINYPYNNVYVFDFYNILTSNGGNANTNDLTQVSGNHHRWWNDALQHQVGVTTNTLAYRTGDDHPSQAGNLKATAEFIPLLNYAYNRWSQSAAVPVASFTGTPAGGPAPLTVAFTDRSTGSSITNRLWDFGDGNITSYAAATNPSHRYVSPGSYTVNLTVTNAIGSKSQLRSNYITVTPQGLQSKISIYRNGSWYMDMNGNGVWGSGDENFGFGAPLWTPVTGDWNNDGHTEIGVYRDGAWYLDYDASGWWSAGDRNYGYGAPGWTPVVGDWNGDGSDTIGVYKDGAWYLDHDGSGTVNTGDKNFAFGSAGWTPVVGKWTPGGKSKVGVYKNGIYYLDSNGDNVFGAGDKTITYGTTDSTAITGDWNANGLTEVGTQTGKTWKLDYDGLGAVNASTKSYTFGADGWKPVIGDWNGDGKDKIGICLNGAWYLDYNGNGVWDAGTDRNSAFGTTGWTPMAGKWD